CTSRRRHTSPSIRYSLSPDRYSRRINSTSRTTSGGSSSTATALSTATPPSALDVVRGRVLPPSRADGTRAATPVSFKRTSAAAVGLRASLPPKITSSIRSPRRLFALCSPSTQVKASTTLLLPHPFG